MVSVINMSPQLHVDSGDESDACCLISISNTSSQLHVDSGDDSDACCLISISNMSSQLHVDSDDSSSACILTFVSDPSSQCHENISASSDIYLTSTATVPDQAAATGRQLLPTDFDYYGWFIAILIDFATAVGLFFNLIDFAMAMRLIALSSALHVPKQYLQKCICLRSKKTGEVWTKTMVALSWIGFNFPVCTRIYVGLYPAMRVEVLCVFIEVMCYFFGVAYIRLAIICTWGAQDIPILPLDEKPRACFIRDFKEKIIDFEPEVRKVMKNMR